MTSASIERCLIAALVFILPAVAVQAQELEPGAYWPIPRGVNIASVIGGVNRGDVAFEPSLPVEEANATISTAALAFTHAFSLAGRSANALVMAPIIGG